MYEFAKKKTQPVNLCLSPRGDMFATMAEDRRIRVFRLLTGKLVTVIDESLQHYTELQQVIYRYPPVPLTRASSTTRNCNR